MAFIDGKRSQMETKPQLIEVVVPAHPVGLVLVLHGGASRRQNMRVSPAQLSVLRMIPVASRIARASTGRLAVFRVLNSHRGWDADHTPVQDAEWALDRARERLGAALPACLVGHSLGGRAALLAAVALAPCVYPTEVANGISGKRILIVHGSADRVASPARSLALANRLGDQADVTYITVEGGNHAMLGRHSPFDQLAADFAAWTLLDALAPGPIARIQSGERRFQL
jgi:pimeloyl-ACP methyl ester carboxylesterase